MRNLLIIIILIFSTNVHANSDAEKITAAKRYLEITPLSVIMNDMAAKIAVQLPENDRATFIKALTEEVDIKLLESIAIDAMAKTFTLKELNAFIDFYGSDVGKSAMSKIGTYMGIIMPAVQQETIRAIKKIEDAKKGAN